jgi:hypothetical protein
MRDLCYAIPKRFMREHQRWISIPNYLKMILNKLKQQMNSKYCHFFPIYLLVDAQLEFRRPVKSSYTKQLEDPATIPVKGSCHQRAPPTWPP